MALALVLGVAGGAAPAQPASFTGLGPLSAANGLSADGSTVIGYAAVTGGTGRWTAPTGWMVLPSPSGSSGSWGPKAVSADGSVIVGNGQSLVIRWTPATGAISLGTPGGYGFAVQAEGISGDGTVVVGTAWKEHGTCSTTGWPLFESTGWRWEADHFHKVDPLGSQNSSFANAVSGDGTVVFGWSADMDCEGQQGAASCRWIGASQATAYYQGVDLRARAASDDGAVAVGYSTWGPAFRWTASGGVVTLGVLPGMTVSDALAVSADGAVVVGFSGVPNGGPWAAAIWDEPHGMRDLRGVLADLGLNLTGWTLTNATGVSADGRTLAGNGTNPAGQEEAWIAYLGDTVCYADCNGDGALTVADFGCFQTKFAAADPYADCNSDGQFTVADFGCFQSTFVAGCP